MTKDGIKLSKLPLLLTCALCASSCYGVLVLYSAAGGNMDPWGSRQLMNFFIFISSAILIAMIDLHLIFRYANIPYIVTLALLVMVQLFGVSAMGARRWIEIASFRLQPAELFKIAIVLALARYFHLIYEGEISSSKKLLWPFVMLIVPVALIIQQPDLGTGVLTVMVGISIFFAAGVDVKKFIAAAIAVIVSTPLIWQCLYDYQKNRIITFLNPELDPLGSGYNIIQSKIAIGSGGIFGKGIGYGTQSHLDFLPEHQTDFIFASLAEEFGFIGVFILFALYFVIILCSTAIAINARSIFGKLLALGITSIFFYHVFVNVAMVIGFLPAVGIPLPFLSYGGTMMASMLCGFGFIMNVHVNSHVHLRCA